MVRIKLTTNQKFDNPIFFLFLISSIQCKGMLMSIAANLFIPEPKFRIYTDSVLYMRNFGSFYSKIVFIYK
jgi:hypothetical protein